jgi:hypothetical protein
VERAKGFWSRIKDFAIVFSFVVNVILVLVVLVLLTQVFAIKDQIVGPLVYGLDESFASLGDATISTTIPIRQQLLVKFNLPIRFDTPAKFNLPVTFMLPLNQETTVTTLTPTPINTTVNLSLGQFGRINAPISLNLPPGTPLRIRLNMNIPVSTTVAVNQMIPVSTTVSVNQMIPVVFDQSAQIKLGPSGLSPVVAKLRGVVKPYVVIMRSLP